MQISSSSPLKITFLCHIGCDLIAGVLLVVTIQEPDMTDEDNYEGMEEQASPYLTTKEAADYLRLRPNTLEQKRMTGDGPRYRNHGVIVYHIDDLNRWSKEQGREKTDGRRRKPGLFRKDEA